MRPKMTKKDARNGLSLSNNVTATDVESREVGVGITYTLLILTVAFLSSMETAQAPKRYYSRLEPSFVDYLGA